MREIKFDVILWDGKDVETIVHFDFESALLEDFIAFKDGAIVPGDNSVIIRQYAGLKDKTGVLIYEGDILKCKRRRKSSSYDNPEYYYENSVIEYWKSFTHIGYRLLDSHGKHLKFQPSHISSMEMEVIGNIYENPELVEGKP